MSSRTSARIAVLMGGRSAEREVSLVSGRACAAALRTEGFDVVEIDAGADLVQALTAASPDVALNALHGRWGEDGCVQGLLEWLRLPYTHSGVLASALAMDKTRAKQVFAAAGLPVVEGLIAARDDVCAAHPMKPPYVVKPNNEGSSVGVYIVHADANGPPHLSDDMPGEVLVEAFVPGRELTVTVMGDRALAVTDIIAEGWYDYHAKYSPGGSYHVVPADLPSDVTAACLDYAKRAHDALGCRGVSRSDFRWDERRGLDGLFILETNTQPGMTPTSLAPEQAAYHGMSFGDLVRWMVEGRLVLPLTRRSQRRDPAPSRMRYRLTRLWLRPAFRRLVNFGVPMIAGLLAVWTLAAELDLRARVVQAATDLREAAIDRPQFLITEMSVPDVSADLAEAIREASFVTLPVNSLEVDVAAVRARVEALAAVERARVRALAGGVLEIRAIERIPVVVWRSGEGLQLLDQGGVRVAEVDSRLRRTDLPLIAGLGADAHVPEALALFAEAAAIAPRIRGLVRVGERRWDVVLDRDQAIKLPEADPLAAMRRVIALEAAEELLARDVSVVDLRDAARPTLRLSEHAQAELIRLKAMMMGEDA